jgi:hypothetical protein
MISRLINKYRIHFLKYTQREKMLIANEEPILVVYWLQVGSLVARDWGCDVCHYDESSQCGANILLLYIANVVPIYFYHIY